ncbi:response regulator, partial [Psychrobacter sp. 1U2]
SHLSLPVSIYTDLDDKTAQKLYKQLELEAKTLQPILLLDYEYYETYTHLAPVTGATDDPSIGNQQRLVNSEQSQVIHKLLNVTSLPKLLLSMKPERSIPSSFLDQFDGFLNKPLDVALLLSELIRLLQSTTVSHKHEDTGKTSESTKKPTMDNNTVEVASAPTILVVDDNLTNQKITCKMLDKLGYPSLVADDGRQALEQLDAQRQQISLILMDCRMPVMDGLQATQVIRSQGNSIPIVALTANNTEEDREACRQAGMDDFLAKPINKDKLKTVLQRLMTTE